jgi:hypothetical protein
MKVSSAAAAVFLVQLLNIISWLIVYSKNLIK